MLNKVRYFTKIPQNLSWGFHVLLPSFKKGGKFSHEGILAYRYRYPAILSKDCQLKVLLHLQEQLSRERERRKEMESVLKEEANAANLKAIRLQRTLEELEAQMAHLSRLGLL